MVDVRILTLVEKILFTRSTHGSNTLEQGGLSLSTSAKRCFPNVNANHWYSNSTTGNLSTSLSYSGIIKKERERKERGPFPNTTSCVRYGYGRGLASVCVAVSGPDSLSLVFIDDVTADRSNKMNSEVYRDLLSAHTQPNATKRKGHCFPVQTDNDPKHTAKQVQFYNGSISHLMSRQHGSFSLTAGCVLPLLSLRQRIIIPRQRDLLNNI